MKAKFTTRVITDLSQVPAGWEQTSRMFPDDRDAQKILSIAQNAEQIAACKLMRSAKDISGPVFIDRETAQFFVKDVRQAKAPPRPSSAPLRPDAMGLILTEICELNAKAERANIIGEQILTELKAIREAWSK